MTNSGNNTTTVESLSELVEQVEEISNIKSIDMNKNHRGLLSFIKRALIQTNPEEISFEEIAALKSTLNWIGRNIDMTLSEASDAMDNLSKAWRGELKEVDDILAAFNIKPIPEELVERAKALTASVEISLDERLPEEDEE